MSHEPVMIEVSATVSILHQGVFFRAGGRYQVDVSQPRIQGLINSRYLAVVNGDYVAQAVGGEPLAVDHPGLGDAAGDTMGDRQSEDAEVEMASPEPKAKRKKVK